MSLQISNAFQVIIGKDGSPLDAGFVYIGESGQNAEAYPIQVFYDEDLTIPAPQPLRTINGYFSRNGSAAKVFCGVSSCSITVRDKNKVLQWLDLGYTGILNQEIQDEMKRGIANRYDPNMIYNVGDVVLLLDGTEAISTAPNNTNDPNVNMTGWEKNRSSNIGYANGDVEDAISRMLSLYDVGYSRQALGYNTESDAEIYDKQAVMPDQSLLMNGSLHLAKKYRGIRRNADVLGIRGGRSSVSNGLDFDDQIVGVANSRGLAAYGMNDGVSLFTDATLPKLESWESVSSASYTSNTATISPTTYATTLLKIKIGDVLQTMHSTKCWGIVTSIDASTGTITVDEWATSGTTVVTPSNGVGFHVNLINKVWAVNFNVMIPEDSEGDGGVVAELGLQIKKPSATVKNGIDMVLLPGSTTNGDAAFLARGTGSYSWNNGFLAQGNLFNYYSLDGVQQPLAGLAENSNAVCGIKFFNKNTYSILWSTSSDQSSVSIPTSPTIFGADGTLLRQPKSLQVLSASGGASEIKITYLLAVAGITVTLPPKAQHVAGHWYEFVLINTGSYTFNGNDTNINGVSAYTFNNTGAYVKYTAIYDGNSWIMYKG